MTNSSGGAEQSMGERIRTRVALFAKGITRNRLRLFFTILVLLSVGVVTTGALTNDLSTASKEVAPEAPPSDNINVITESGRAGTIIAYNADGSILYYNNSRTKYFDVDPVEGEENVVEYTATDTINSEGPSCSQPTCARNYIEREPRNWRD